MADHLSALIQAVDEADSANKLMDAVERLAAAQLEGSIPTLIATLSYNNPGAAVKAVEGLIQLGEPAVPSLLEQLDLYNYTARAWAIRALAGIGDPRGLVTLLGAATADFSLSVRRAAARGLGMMKWYWFPADLLTLAQAEVLEALLFVAQADEEWVVRYAAVVGLEALAVAIGNTQTDWQLQIKTQFEQLATDDDSLAVRARVWQAQHVLQETAQALPSPVVDEQPSPLSTSDWQTILDNLYARKHQERCNVADDDFSLEQPALAEGDPRRYLSIAVSMSPATESDETE